MAEYIEKEAIIKDLELLAKYQYGERQQGILGVCETIKRKPAADVVEVVRCGECEHEQYCRIAQHLGIDGYCSKGERRSE